MRSNKILNLDLLVADSSVYAKLDHFDFEEIKDLGIIHEPYPTQDLPSLDQLEP